MVGNHNLYHHSIDDHNNKWHSPISLEVVWVTKYWSNHMFTFILSITEVNVNLAVIYFCEQQQMSQIEFWKLLAKTLIYNNHYNEEMDETPNKNQKKGVNFSGTQIITANNAYLQTQVQNLQKRVCIYCLCSPGIYWCTEFLGITLPVPKKSFNTKLNSAG